MTDIAMFHSVLGVRPGVHAAADLLRSHGHTVHVIDQYDGRVFSDYGEAAAFAETLGYPALMAAAVELTRALPEGLVCMGFSNGAAMAQFVASSRQGVGGAVLLSGAIDPTELGLTAWPPTVPVQIHFTVDDPFRQQAWLEAAVGAVRAAGAEVEQFNYPGSGHLFTDPSLEGEYQPIEAEQLWPRVLDFIARVG
ncbi:MAG: dienelactone hydrolase family protein [Propionibacteriales bacterium]|nr:dienelactone hydrolase family protein [Propionibacteriales bacterium]